MIPVILKMKNFLSYEDEEFDFSQVSNATVTGHNGAGKSSFCTDAITWALFGKGSRGGERDGGNYVSIGADSCTVELEFKLNGSTYKVIRSLNARKNNKMVLNLFVLDSAGNEVPLTGVNLTTTQASVEELLKMSYRTFTASSMIFQGKSDEFTNGMSDADRKEALVNILNISEWDEIGDKAKDRASTLRQEIADTESHIGVKEDIISHKAEYEQGKAQAVSLLKDISDNKKKYQKVIEDNQKAVFQRDTLAQEIQKKQVGLADVEARISRNNTEMKDKQSDIEKNNHLLQENADKIAKQQAVLVRQKEIDDAVEKEKTLTEAVNALWQKQNQYTEAQTSLNEIANKGKLWKANWQKDVKAVEDKIAGAQKQADALSSMPCANNEELTSTCPLLSMAREAEKSLADLKKKQSELTEAVNPFTQKWMDEKKRLASLLIDPQEAGQKRKELADVQKISRLKPVLDNAASYINSLIEQNEQTEKANKSAKNRINEVREQMSADKAEQEKMVDEKAVLEKSLTEFDAVYQEQETAKKALRDLETQEAGRHNEVGSFETLLTQVADAEKAKKDLEKKRDGLSQELSDTNLLLEACGKKSGVPSLIVENAVPELEAISNQILENMMDGRLQVRLDTQVETNKGTVREVFRITVLDDGYERRYETYSGAEKFVVDLAIRIAMSKFLSKRAGASVQLFVLDEGVSCADENNRVEIVKAIRSICGEFAKVLFVTHIEELKDCLDQRIEVTKTSQGSHIKIR